MRDGAYAAVRNAAALWMPRKKTSDRIWFRILEEAAAPQSRRACGPDNSRSRDDASQFGSVMMVHVLITQ